MPSQHTRRAVLAAAAIVTAGIAGCTDPGDAPGYEFEPEGRHRPE